MRAHVTRMTLIENETRLFPVDDEARRKMYRAAAGWQNNAITFMEF